MTAAVVDLATVRLARQAMQLPPRDYLRYQVATLRQMAELIGWARAIAIPTDAEIDDMGELRTRAAIQRMFGLVDAIGPEWERYLEAGRVVWEWIEALNGMTDEQREGFRDAMQQMMGG